MLKSRVSAIEYAKSNPMLLSLIIILIATHLTIMFQFKPDTDIWGRILFGNDVLKQHNPYLIDNYSYVTNHVKWIDIEWLSGVIFALMFDIGKSIGLIFFKVAIECIILLNIYNVFKYFKVNTLATFWFLATTVDLISMGTNVIRAHLFTYIFINYLFYFIINYRYRSYKYLYFIPIMFVPWVNTHGGFVAGLCFYGFFCVTETVRLKYFNDTKLLSNVDKTKIKVMFTTLFLSCLLTLINPWGIDLLKTVLVPDIISRPEITEWQPLKIMTLNALIYLIDLSIAIFVFIKSKEKIYFPEFLLFLILSIVPFLAMRHLPLFVVTIFMLIAPHINSASQNSVLKDFKSIESSNSKTGFYLLIFSLMYLGLSVFVTIRSLGDVTYEGMPYWSMRLLQESKVKANMANFFNWGEYLIYHLAPNIKVSLDSRRELAYGKKVYNENFLFQYGIGHWNRILTDYSTDMALIEYGSVPYNLLSLYSPYEMVFRDNVSVLFVRKDFPQMNELKRLVPKYNALVEQDKTNKHIFP